MNNFIKPGDTLTLTAPTGGVVSGGAYKIGQLLVVAAADAAQNTPFEGKRSGVFTLPKDGGVAWTEGDPLYWDDVAKDLTPVSAVGLLLVGVAAKSALLAATTGEALLDGVTRLDA